MQSSRTIFVTGATGKQGGAAAGYLIRQGFRVKALLRNPASSRAQSLSELGVDIITGDLNNPDTYREHLKNTDGIFCVLSYKQPQEKEIKQGIDLANLAKEYGIGHFIYSSVSGADLNTGVPHWDSKWVIEQHIRQLGLPYTILRPASFYENFLIPQVRNNLLKGKFVTPIDKDVVQYMISADDVGRIAAGIFSKPEPYLGKTITIAAEHLDATQVAAVFSAALGRTVGYQKLPGLLVRLFLGRKLYKMCRWVNMHSNYLPDYTRELNDGMAELKKDFPVLIGLRQWIENTFKSG